MTETQKRISELKRALPNIREKVIAVAIMLAMSVAMMASVSYAWYTLSLNPEASNITTTVSSNGNLEIALSGLEGLEPNSSAVGDSFSADGQTTVNANLTWGNLLNLSSNYGIENLILRPATLDLQSDSLLYGVQYGEDGRVEGIASDFDFTTWYQTDKTLNTWKFVSPTGYPTVYKNGTAYGVRAISSVAYEGNQSEILTKLDNANVLNREAKSSYKALYSNSDYVSVITSLVDVYLDAQIDAFIDYYLSNTPMTGEVDVDLDFKTYIVPMRNMLEELYNSVCQLGDALAYMANIQADRDDLTRNDILNMSDSELKAIGVQLTNSLKAVKTSKTNFLGYRALYNTVFADYTEMQRLYDENKSSSSSVSWAEIEDIINNLISINTLTVNGKTIGQITGSGGTNAINFINSLPANPDIILYNGTLWSFEHITGEYLTMAIPVNVNALGIVKYSGTGIMFTSTSLEANSMFAKDKKAIEDSVDNLSRGTIVAQDTYAMVLDIWVRTNADNSLLTLNGTPEIEEYYEQRMILISGESSSRPVYYYARPTGDTMAGEVLTEEILVYIGDDGNVYNCTTYSQEYVYNDDGTVTDTPLTEADVTAKMDKKTRVVGFSSSNRIWQEGDTENNPPVLDEGQISSTQGSGSCYIFYANTPEESARSLELLANLKLAFLDAQNNLLATAILDVDNVYAENGKYTIPIAIEKTSYITENEDGEQIYGICPLVKNEATRISVLIYLDGQTLENEMVMTEDDIVGSLNIQFDSTADLSSLGDSALSMDVISLRAEIDTNTFNYTGAVQTATLSAYIDGMEPGTVQAIFQRRVNATQGSRMEAVTMTNTGGSAWTAEVPFKSPGTYVLSSLWVDGIEYPLPEAITVTVNGFEVSSVNFDESSVLTVNRSTTKSLSVTLNADLSAQPSTVQARFMTEDGHSVNATLTRDNNGVWTGTATFNSSGTYTLQYLVMDGEYYELKEEMQRQFTAYLGLTTNVYLQRYVPATDADGNILYDDDGNVIESETLGALDYIYEEGCTTRIVALADIYDDAGNLLKGLDGVVLYYAPLGSTTAENGFSFELNWNGSQYVGATANREKTGAFVFNKLTIGSNVLTSASTSPTLTIRAKDPPSFTVSGMDETKDTIVVNGTAYYTVSIADASYARNYVVFRNGAGKYYAMPLTKGEGDSYTAAFPSVGAYGQNDEWTVVRIVSAGITVEGTAYDGIYTGTETVDSAFLTAEAAEAAVNTTDFYTVKTKSGETVPTETYKVINTVQIALGDGDADSSDDVLVFGKDADGKITGTFMQSHTFNNLNFTVTIPNMDQTTVNAVLGEMKVTLTYDQTKSGTYGSYTTTTVLNANFPLTATSSFTSLPNTAATAGGTYALSGTVQYAGVYAYSVQVKVGGVQFGNVDDKNNVYAGTPAVEVWSKKPTVTVTGVGTTSSIPTQITWTQKGNKYTGYYASYTLTGYQTNVINQANNSVIVYAEAGKDNKGEGVGYGDAGFVRPTLQFTVAGVDSQSTVSFTIPTDQTNGRAVAFTQTGNGVSDWVTLGKTGSIKTWGPNVSTLGATYTLYAYYGQGTQTIKEVTIVREGITYKVTLGQQITINNPSSVNKTS